MGESLLKTIGKYQILDQIGTSAAGITYRARDAFRNRELAVKVIRDVSPLNAELKDRFYTALAACSELSHRHIRKIHDLGEVEGQVYIASELLTGVDLAGCLDGQSVPIADKLSLIAQVCEALAFAHGKGIAHGNLKPGNIFVANARDATVLDFGIGTWQACMFAGGARLDGLLPNYLAPEQILGQPFDARSDLFSLALILYESLAGKYPFQVPAGLIPRELVHSEPEPLRKLDPQMPEELEQLLVSALNKNPQQRLQTADEFAASLYKIARKLRRDQAAALVAEAGPPPARSEPERSSASESPRAENGRSEKKTDARNHPAPLDTALQPWTARSFGAQSQNREASPAAPAREEPVRAQSSSPAPQQADALVAQPSAFESPILQPAAVQASSAPPTVQLPAFHPPAAASPLAPLPAVPPPPRAAAPPAPPVGARIDPKSSPMPRRFQRTAPPPSASKLRTRILTGVAGAVIAVWLVASFVSRQSLHATQGKDRIESVAPKDTAHDTESRPLAEPQTIPEQEPPKPVEPAKKELSAEQILRLRVKPLWEAGKYAQAMDEVDQALAANPESAEARIWKKRIRAAQDAEAAVK
jgi:serine/threonine-protein kinase